MSLVKEQIDRIKRLVGDNWQLDIAASGLVWGLGGSRLNWRAEDALAALDDAGISELLASLNRRADSMGHVVALVNAAVLKDHRIADFTLLTTDLTVAECISTQLVTEERRIS